MDWGPLTDHLTVAPSAVRTSKRTNLGHFDTTGDIELPKVQRPTR
jgi:hypothetical protein